MLLPIAYPLNYRLAYESEPGDIVEVYDKKFIVIVEKVVIPAKSPYAEALSQLIYGFKSETVVKIMSKNEGGDILIEDLLLIIYKKYENSGTNTENYKYPNGDIGEDQEGQNQEATGEEDFIQSEDIRDMPELSGDESE